MRQHEVMIYALSTCPWCSKTKLWFEDAGIPFKHVDVDSLDADEAKAMADEADRVSGGRRFPVIVIDGDVIVGFKPEEFEQRINRDSVASGD